MEHLSVSLSVSLTLHQINEIKILQKIYVFLFLICICFNLPDLHKGFEANKYSFIY